MDLGCGDGFLGKIILEEYSAEGTFLDCSEEMINRAKEKIRSASEFIVRDFGGDDWKSALKPNKKFDLIISGYAIHHINDNQKKRLYRDVYELLTPDGIFLNLEHVSSPTKEVEEIFNDLFNDCLVAYHNSIGENKSKNDIKELYNDPEHKVLNQLASVEDQCKWLREIGFKNVDCFIKIFELALIGGIKDGRHCENQAR